MDQRLKRRVAEPVIVRTSKSGLAARLLVRVLGLALLTVAISVSSCQAFFQQVAAVETPRTLELARER